MGVLLVLSGSLAAVVVGVAGAYAYLLLSAASRRQPMIFAVVLLLTLEILPPFYFPASGEVPVFISFFLLPIALVIVATRFHEMHFEWDSVARGLAIFLAGTALSIPFAFWLSGTSVGMESLSRWILLSHAALAFYMIRGGAWREATRTERQMPRILLAGAVLSACYGIVDFIWPVPLQHPAADQFIWLNGTVLRRAQGVFYESSNFGNFCAFFLIACGIAFLFRRERYLGIPRLLLIASISILSLAVLVAFSRTTWVSLIVAVFASLVMSGRVKFSRIMAAFVAAAVPIILLWTLSPELWSYLVNSRIGQVMDIFDDPNFATSGRFDTWIRVLSIMRDQPQYLLFGIGYKTLGITRIFHGEIITDNGYLSLLLETGIAGLAGFIVLSGAILRTFFRLAHSTNELLAFWATVLFSTWCGELVQLLAMDAYTYWRNIVVFAALMAWTLNLAERTEISGKPG
jgi:O-antigen ligase